MELDICNTLTLKGNDYSVVVQVSEGVLSVDVELSSSTEQWHGMFDKNYIEELTRKTGNFKQFNVFCNMLETALMRTSDAVSLDLLTIADLEALRQKRSADVRFQATAMRVLTPQNGLSQNGVAQSNGSQKRYLILTYTAQFDRIHYPLPLTYTGRPNPRRLQQEIRALKNELRRTRAKPTSLPGDARATSSMIGSVQQESRAAHFEVDRLRDEKAALEREINDLRLRKLHSEFSVHEPEKELHGVTSSPRGADDAPHNGEQYSARSGGEQKQRSAIEFTRMLVAKNEELRREIRLLKGVVQNVEAERIREKSEFQKALAKRQREFRELTEQLDVLRTSERSLRIKLKQTTNELEAFKRMYRAGSSRSYAAHSASLDRDSSRDRTTFERRTSAGGCPPRSRSVSAERSAVKPPKRPESAREVRKRDRLERALLDSLPKSAREFFGDGPSAALRDAPPFGGLAKPRSRSNSASSATRGVIVPAPKRAASPALIAPKSGASHSLPGSRRTTPRSSVEREPVGKPRPQSRSNSRERERGGRIKSPSPVQRPSKRDATSPFLYRPIEPNGRSTQTKMAEPKRKVRNDDNELKLTLDKHAEAEADRDLEEIDARLQRIQNMMKHYRVPAR